MTEKIHPVPAISTLVSVEPLTGANQTQTCWAQVSPSDEGHKDHATVTTAQTKINSEKEDNSQSPPHNIEHTTILASLFTRGGANTQHGMECTRASAAVSLACWTEPRHATLYTPAQHKPLLAPREGQASRQNKQPNNPHGGHYGHKQRQRWFRGYSNS
mmetsp:Transcript_9680/g.22819  ORF Transcript_9680/g.22819 Transcript_9680/m.22819 type:complete len:159 (-) Transcript_9680:164-640(-)